MIKITDLLSVLQHKKCIGLSLVKIGEDTYEADLVELSKDKSNISITNKESFSDNLNKIIEHIPKGSPILLSLDGKGLLHKTSNASHKNNNELVNSIFPNIKLAEFYFQKQELQSGSYFVSLIRQNIVDELIGKFNENGIFTIGFSLGPTFLKHLLPFIESNNQLFVKNYLIETSEGKINSIERISENEEESNRTYHVDTEQITSAYLLPVALAFGYFLNIYKQDEPISELIKKSREEFKFNQLFKVISTISLGALLFILLINFVFFSYFNDKYNQVSTQYAMQKDNIAQMDTLAIKLETKEKVIKEKKLFLRSRFSYFCDRIALLLPNEVQLTQLDIQPLLSNIEEGKMIEFDQAKIVIKGSSNSSIVVGDWISLLKKENWANKVIMKDYTYDNKDNKANFNIEITLNNER